MRRNTPEFRGQIYKATLAERKREFKGKNAAPNVFPRPVPRRCQACSRLFPSKGAADDLCALCRTDEAVA